jgi:hypothetical protein
MIKKLTITDLNISVNGALEVRLYVYLTRKYSFVLTDFETLVHDAMKVFKSDEVHSLITQWFVSQ